LGKTKYEIKGRDFYINGKPTYSEIPGSNENVHGLLFNARFIQGVFQDINPKNQGDYNRFGKTFDPEKNTDDLIAALPDWYNYGMRAFTVGLVGGGPCMSLTDWGSLEFGTFSSDGKTMDTGVFDRLVRIIDAADRLGMLVIVSYLYQGQLRYFDNDSAIETACKTATDAICGLDYDNIIIEVANEYDIFEPKVPQTKLYEPEKMASLVEKVKTWCGGRFAVGSSTYCIKESDRPVMQASDICIFHGNDSRREELHARAKMIRKWCPDKPLVVNEDSAMVTQMDVAFEDHFSWGYYNNLTKQEPPTDWNITPGEDRYFAYRMAKGIGIKVPEIDEDSIMLQGFEPNINLSDGGRFVRVSSLHPERIDKVRFYEDGKLLDVSFDEPFYYLPTKTWSQAAYIQSPDAKEFAAEVIKYDGTIVWLKQDLTTLINDKR